MPEYAGGLRLKLIRESFAETLRTCMSELHWFTSNAQVKPVTLLTEQYDTFSEIKPNAVGISNEDITNLELELGSGLEENRWGTYVDIFAEDESVGIHLSGDIYDIIRGKIAGRTDPSFKVYDYSLNEKPYLFTCELENIEVARVREWDKPFNRYWWVVACEIVDHYTGEGS